MRLYQNNLSLSTDSIWEKRLILNAPGCGKCYKKGCLVQNKKTPLEKFSNKNTFFKQKTVCFNAEKNGQEDPPLPVLNEQFVKGSFCQKNFDWHQFLDPANTAVLQRIF